MVNITLSDVAEIVGGMCAHRGYWPIQPQLRTPTQEHFYKQQACRAKFVGDLESIEKSEASVNEPSMAVGKDSDVKIPKN